MTIKDYKRKTYPCFRIFNANTIFAALKISVYIPTCFLTRQIAQGNHQAGILGYSFLIRPQCNSNCRRSNPPGSHWRCQGRGPPHFDSSWECQCTNRDCWCSPCVLPDNLSRIQDRMSSCLVSDQNIGVLGQQTHRHRIQESRSSQGRSSYDEEKKSFSCFLLGTFLGEGTKTRITNMTRVTQATGKIFYIVTWVEC